MTDFTITIHPEQDWQAQQIKRIRTVCKGSAYVKRDTTDFLPNPVNDSAVSSAEYQSFLQGALLDDWARLSQKTMLGKAKFGSAKFDDPNLGYINNNVDGDGMSLGGLLHNAAGSILEAKYECWVVDNKGLTNVDPETLSVADVEELNPRPVVKRYHRESIVCEPYFKMINGRRQLSYIAFKEQELEFDMCKLKAMPTEAYLILALDDAGNYYQQKVVDGVKGDANYVSINGKPLKFIPLIFVSDEEISTELPEEFGFLSGIVDIVLTKYQNSANKSRFLKKKVPTDLLYTGETEGISEEWQESFNLLNAGNKKTQASFKLGGLNTIPGENARFESVSSVGTLDDYFKEDESLENRARQLGAVIAPNEVVTKTATESLIDEATRNAVLMPLADSLEDSVKWLVAYFAMFEGRVDQESLVSFQGDVDFAIDRSFAIKKVTIDELRFFWEALNFPFLAADAENPAQASADAFADFMKRNGYGDIMLSLQQ